MSEKPSSLKLRPAAYITVMTGLQFTVALGLQVALSFWFGADRDLDAYFVALGLPQLLQLALGSGLSAVLPPLLATGEGASFKHGLARDGFLVIVVGAALVGGALVLVSDLLAVLLAPGLFRAEGDPRLLSELLKVTCALVPLHAATAYLTALAVSRRRFFLWPLAGLGGACLHLGCVLFFAPTLGISAAVLGYALSAATQFLVLSVNLPRFRGVRRSAPQELRSLLALVLPVFSARLLTRITTVSDRWIASWLGAGAISHVVYGTRLPAASASILPSGISTTLLPRLSELKGKNDDKAFDESVIRAVRLLFFLILPVSSLFLAWPHEIIEGLLARGEFDAADVGPTAAVLSISAGWLTFSVVGNPIVTALYASRSQKAVSLVSMATALINLVVAFFLSRVFGVAGIPAAFTLTALTNVTLFTLILRRRHGTLLLRPLRSWRDPNLIAGGLLWVYLLALPPEAEAGIFSLGLRVGGAGVLYFAAALAMRSREATEVLESTPWVRRRT